MTKEPAGLETMKTKLRLPSPTSLTDKSSKLSASLEERAGTDFMYSMRNLSSSGRNSDKDMVAAGEEGEGVEQWYSLPSRKWMESFVRFFYSIWSRETLTNSWEFFFFFYGNRNFILHV